MTPKERRLLRKQKDKNLLGMEYTAATHRLMRMLLLYLAKKCGMGICYRCEKEILTYKELSIEHKIPWRIDGSKLFWDLENIAFSHHQVCNKNHGKGNIKYRRISLEGYAWCGKCRQFKLVDQFYKHKTRWNGVRSHCKSCWKLQYERKCARLRQELSINEKTDSYSKL